MNKIEVFVIGSGKLGASIARKLCSQGKNVLVIDVKPQAFLKLEDYSGFYEEGNALDIDFLIEQGIKDSEMIVLTTNNDNTNLFLADVCHDIFHIPYIYLRLNDAKKKKLVEDKGIKCICPFLLSLDYFSDLCEKGGLSK